MWGSVVQYSLGTYGGAPAILAVNLLQIALGVKVLWLLLGGWRDSTRSLEAAELRTRALARAGAYKSVRPIVVALLAIGPGLGMLFATLLSSTAMRGMGAAMADVEQTRLMESVGLAYSDVALAYYLMVAGTVPLVTGSLTLVFGAPIERSGEKALGGPISELMLLELRLIRAALTRGREE